jgi:hypothetical protein
MIDARQKTPLLVVGRCHFTDTKTKKLPLKKCYHANACVFALLQANALNTYFFDDFQDLPLRNRPFW